MDDIQTMLQDSANALFGDIVTAEALQRSEAGEFLQDMWNAVAEQGFTLAMRSEINGGSAMSWAQIYPLLHASGRYTLPLPLVETLLANYFLEMAGCQATNGTMAMTLAQVPGHSITQRDGIACISAKLESIPFGSQATRIVLSTDIDGVPYVGWIDMASHSPSNTISIQEKALNIAREPRDTIALEQAPIQELRPATPLGNRAVIRYGAMLRAAQIAGAIECVLEQTLAYAGERIQFGRPLAKFQAIQHHIAELGCEAGAVATAAAYACEQINQQGADLAVAAAKIRASRAAGKTAALAHAVHGAIGFTYEHSLQYATRRLWSWRSEYGTHGWWSYLLGNAICEQGPQSWWSIATSGQLELRDQLEEING